MRKRLRHELAWLVALVALTAGTAVVAAQVYEWVDEENVRHFATSLESVPPEVRSKARVVVEGAASTTGDADSPSSAGTPSEADGRRSTTSTSQGENEAPAAYASGWDVGFQAGWDAGFQAALDQQPICTAEPEVVVLESRPPDVINIPRYDPAGVYYRSPYQGSITVPFDGGRSRGLTRRQLEMQRGRR